MPAASARAVRSPARRLPERPLLLTVDEAAEALRVSKATLFNLLKAGNGPRSVRVNRRRLFKPADIESFIERCAA